MNQSDIFQIVTGLFAQKFENLAKVKIKDPVDDQKKEDQPIILITLLGMEEVILHNLTEKIKCEERDKNGVISTYYLPPASLFNLHFMLTPYFKTYADTLKILGQAVRLIKENNEIKVDPAIDWLENNQKPILVSPYPIVSLEKQMQLFNMLGLEYRPSLFYQFTVGVNSEKKEYVKRVEERKFTTFDKTKVK